MRNGIKIIVIAFLLSTLMVSCIYDEFPNHRQCDISLRLVNSRGAVLSDSVAHLYNIDWFVNGIYKRTVAAEKDGKYRVTFNSTDRVTLVAVAASDTSECHENTPILDESIKDTWLQLKTGGGNTSPQPHAIYYGDLDVTPDENVSDDDPAKSYTILMKDMRAKVRVEIKGLKTRFGDGGYRIVLEGLRSGIAYDGSVTGVLVNYDMKGSFDSQGNYTTLPDEVLPTKSGERVSIKVYKQDGSLLFDRDVDEQGNPLEVKKNDDIVFVINASYLTDLTVTIVPWADIENPTSFQ
jgi:hypothetical protein